MSKIEQAFISTNQRELRRNDRSGQKAMQAAQLHYFKPPCTPTYEKRRSARESDFAELPNPGGVRED
jgi:hypothetical protein